MSKLHKKLNSRQKWIFEKFKVSLSQLKPTVRVKAMEIAEQLIEDGYSDEVAMEMAKKRAEEWFLNLNG